MDRPNRAHRAIWSPSSNNGRALLSRLSTSKDAQPVRSFKTAAHSFLFAIYHFDAPWMIPVRTLGLLPLIYVTMHTRSVKPSIVAHCLVNLTNFIETISKRVGTP